MITILEYFEDIQADVGLPESWMQRDSNYVTRVAKTYVKRESNWIKKN